MIIPEAVVPNHKCSCCCDISIDEIKSCTPVEDSVGENAGDSHLGTVSWQISRDDWDEETYNGDNSTGGVLAHHPVEDSEERKAQAGDAHHEIQLDVRLARSENYSMQQGAETSTPSM